MPSRQIPLSLPHRASLSRADFLIGAANAEAIAFIDAWPDWPTRTALLAGPMGSGKSHLVEIWRGGSGAQAVTASALTMGLGIAALAATLGLVLILAGAGVIWAVRPAEASEKAKVGAPVPAPTPA